MDQQDQPQATSSRPSGRWPRIALILGAVAIGVFFYCETSRPWRRIGDGQEYLCMTYNWLSSFTPWAKAKTLAACATELGFASGTYSFIERGPGFDAYHFWLLSLLAAPFCAIAKLVGLPLPYGYSLFHCLLFIGVFWRLRNALGLVAATGIAFLLACSPLLFFIDKAHGEFFLCSMLLLALAEIHSERWAWAALWLALGSCQQTVLGIFVLALMAIAYFRRRQWLPLGLSAFFLLLPPGYYLIRHGTPSLLSKLGAVAPHLASAHRALSLYVDPDIGLFCNWPLGIAAALVALALAVQRRRAAVTALLALLALPVMVSVQSNWNGGGTIHVSRYAVLLIPLMAFCCGIALQCLATLKAPIGLVCAWAAVLAVPSLNGLAGPSYSPKREEVSLVHTPVATWLYDRHPRWYDPEPEVFTERTLHRELGRWWPSTWIVGNPKCNKLLLLKPVGQIPGGSLSGLPAGCSAKSGLDLNLLAKELKAGLRRPTSLGYINL